MPRNAKLRYLIPALIALTTVIYGVITSAVNTEVNFRDRERVAHSTKVIKSLKDTLRYMLDLETGQRGYVIVGEEAYLKPYQDALGQLDTEIAKLTDLTKDQGAQQIRIGQIREVIELRKKSLASTIQVRRNQGLEAALLQVKNGGGKAQMDRLRDLIGEMLTFENKLLTNREEKLSRTLRRTNLTVIISGCVAVVAGILGTLLLLLFLSARDREDQLRTLKEKAEEADRAKSDFLAMMSHEIRTPMNAILGFGELLHDLVESPQQKHFAGAILSSGNSLLSLINDILDLSKIEAGKIDIQAETIFVQKFAENLETLFSFRAAEKGLVYEVQVDSRLPSLLSFDALRLRQVLVNLAGNAIKFSHEGSVIVRFYPGDIGTDDSLTLMIDVTDSGIGISEEHLSEIFRPFYQIDSRQGRQFQGTGLGLSISHRLIEAMGGELTVESTLGQGSTFHVSLPTQVKRQAEEQFLRSFHDTSPSVDFNLLKPSKIVVADDEPLNRELIRSYLAGTSHEVYEAENGEQAVAICLRVEPDLVLMDIRMPAMDGREALARLRASDKTRHIPLIAVTASSLLNSQQELKSIFDSFADKPISRAKLFVELSKFISPAVPAVESSQIKSPFDLHELDPVITARDWSELCAVLDQLKASTWPHLVAIVPAQATIKFAEELQSLAETHSCPLLADHARQLLHSAQMMDFNEAGRLLKIFPEIIASLRHSHA